MKHCFPGPGKYTVKLDIFDIKTNRLFFSKLAFIVQLDEHKQPYIDSPDTVIKGVPVSFDGQKSNIPGFKVMSYRWNFRDGDKGTGEKITHTFKKSGEFRVNMELIIKSSSTGEIRKTGASKYIKVFNDNSEMSFCEDDDVFIITSLIYEVMKTAGQGHSFRLRMNLQKMQFTMWN